MIDGEAGRVTTVGTGDRPGLDRLLGVPETAWLLDRVRGRILDAEGKPLSGVVRLNEPSPAQRAAVVRLIGRPRRAGSALRVDLGVVEEILRRGPWPAGLADAVETLSGPVVDRRAERVREAAGWQLARDGLTAGAARFPGLGDWWEAWCADGGLKRSARAEAARTGSSVGPDIAVDLVRKAAAVLEVLPASGEPLAVLARRVVGDAHALDSARPLGRLAGAIAGVAFAPDAAASGRGSSVRDAWAAAGVVLSNVASTVLCLGVPGVSPDEAEGVGSSSRTATATMLEAMRVARMPLLLTLDQVRSGGVRSLRHDDVVYVCENPTVVEVVAKRWARTVSDAPSGGAGPVLVCTGGQPSTAVLELVDFLTRRGAECRYHGDYDWAGLRIARSLSSHVPWVPWRYTAADYLAAVQDGRPSLGLAGSPAESPWNPGLAAAMALHGQAVEEEAMADLLATDVLTERVAATAGSTRSDSVSPRDPLARNA